MESPRAVGGGVFFSSAFSWRGGAAEVREGLGHRRRATWGVADGSTGGRA